MDRIIKFIVVLSFAALGLHAQSAEDVLEKMVAASGGEKALVRLNDYEQQWHIETMTSDTNGTDSRMVNLPFMLRTELVYPHKSELRMLVNDYGTKQVDQKKIQASGPMLDAMRLQRMRLYHPLLLKRQSRHITLAQTPEYYVLSLGEKGISSDYYVSKKSYFIEKVVGTLDMGGSSMEFVTLYEEYRPQEGVMVPHKEIKFAGGVNTAVMRLQAMHFTGAPQKHR